MNIKERDWEGWDRIYLGQERDLFEDCNIPVQMDSDARNCQ